MTDFVPTSESKNAIRTLPAPIADVATFNSIVESVLTNNPFGCVQYIAGGAVHPAVEKTRERYTILFSYEQPGNKPGGNGSHTFVSRAGYEAGLTAVAAAAALTEAHGGEFVHDPDDDSFTATLKCHDSNGELYNVVISRTRVALQSYADDAILSKVEQWADLVPALA